MKIHKIQYKYTYKYNTNTKHKYNRWFIESEQKFLNEKSFETSNLYGLPKFHKSKVIEAAIHSQNTGSRGSGTSQLETQTNCWRATLSNKKT